MDTCMHTKWKEPAQLASKKFCEVQHLGLMVYIQSCEQKEPGKKTYWALTSAFAPMSLMGLSYYFNLSFLYYRCSYASIWV